jgi:hypothetical protein
MLNFTKKLAGAMGLAACFAAASYAQTFTCGPNGGNPANAPTSTSGTNAASTAQAPIIDRVEDTTALVADLTFSCQAGNSLSNGTVTVSLNEPVTSRTASVNGTTQSEAALTITPAGGGASTTYLGTVNGNTITFSGVNFPSTAFGATIQNVRVNASAAPNGNSNFTITESVLVTNLGFAVYSTLPTPVGIVAQGFATPTVSGVANYVLCTGNPIGNATASFSVKVAELFPAAFKTVTPNSSANQCNGGTCPITNGESGSLPGAGGVAAFGTATHGTRFQVSFANIPSGVTIYLPTTITNGPLTVQLTSSATGAFSAVAASVPNGSNLAGVAPFVGNGAGTVNAYYEVTRTDATVSNENFTVTGFVTAAANFQTTATTPITVTVTPAPTGSTDIPNFAASANTAQNITAFNTCQTSLLFPFVTNQMGFDTGMAITNTSTDPLKTGASATPQGGTCQLYFYGSGAPTTAVAPSATVNAASPVYTAVLSTVAPGFQGYAIAQCNFLDAHGFAFITYQLGSASGVAEGYLALVLPANRNVGGAIETLTQ